MTLLVVPCRRKTGEPLSPEPTPAERALYEAILEEVRRRADAPASTRRALRFLMEAAGSSPHAALSSLRRSTLEDGAGPEGDTPEEEAPLALPRLVGLATGAPFRYRYPLMTSKCILCWIGLDTIRAIRLEARCGRCSRAID